MFKKKSSVYNGLKSPMENIYEIIWTCYEEKRTGPSTIYTIGNRLFRLCTYLYVYIYYRFIVRFPIGKVQFMKQFCEKLSAIYYNNNLYSYITGRTDSTQKIIFNLTM